jgi:hypothetical protein
MPFESEEVFMVKLDIYFIEHQSRKRRVPIILNYFAGSKEKRLTIPKIN